MDVHVPEVAAQRNEFINSAQGLIQYIEDLL